VDRSVRSGEQLDLAGVAAIARRGRWTLLAGALAGMALVVAVAGSGRPGYDAAVKLLVGPIGGNYTALKAASHQGQTYADLATSEPLLEASRARLASGMVAGAPLSVAAKADYFTRILTITARGRTRAAAMAIASAVADELRRVTRTRQPGGSGELSRLGAVEVSPAANGSRPKTLGAVAALTGLLAALTLLVNIELRRRRRAPAPGLARGSA
jgi:capsular polysaccharide biosynthesis protein